MPHRTNLPKVKEISEQEFHNNLVLGLARAAINVGRGEMLTNLIDFAAAVNTDQREGNADHRARIKLADKARPVVQDAMGVIREADRLRGVA